MFRIRFNLNLHSSGVDTEVLTVTLDRKKGDEHFQVINDVRVHFQMTHLNRIYIVFKENHGSVQFRGCSLRDFIFMAPSFEVWLVVFSLVIEL